MTFLQFFPAKQASKKNDVNDRKQRNRKKISLNPISSTIYSGLTLRIEDKLGTVPSSNPPDAPQSSRVLAQTQQLTQHSLGHRCHHSLFAMSFESDRVSHGRPCRNCE